MYMILSQLTLSCSYYFVHTAHHALVCDIKPDLFPDRALLYIATYDIKV